MNKTKKGVSLQKKKEMEKMKKNETLKNMVILILVNVVKAGLMFLATGCLAELVTEFVIDVGVDILVLYLLKRD